MRSLTLRTRACNTDGVVTGEGLALRQTRRLSFKACGESTYVLEATLADGRVLHGKEGYAEPGYALTEKITPAGIEPGPMRNY